MIHDHRTRQVSRSALALVGAACALLVAARLAAADNVTTLVNDLTTSSDYKVRLSAAASLIKLGDPRAIQAFVTVLGKDPEKTVRASAAVGLGKVVTSDTDAALRDAAIKALEKASKSDKDDFVKKQAAKSLATLKKLAAAPAVAAGGIFVDVGQMSAQDAGLQKLMRSTTEKTFARNAAEMVTAWPGGKAPTKKDLAAKKTQAFHVDGTLNEVTTQAKGSAMIVSCKVNMLIATYPDKSMFGFLNGGATVQASNDPRDVEDAKKDCVMAVVEDLVIKKIIPTIKAKAGP